MPEPLSPHLSARTTSFLTIRLLGATGTPIPTTLSAMGVGMAIIGISGEYSTRCDQREHGVAAEKNRTQDALILITEGYLNSSFSKTFLNL